MAYDLAGMAKKLTLKDLALVIVGSVMFSIGINLFITPIALYNAGVVGISQLLRTWVLNTFEVEVSFDLSGLFNALINIPLFFLAYKSLSKKFLVGTVISLIIQTMIISFFPIPAEPLVDDILVGCIAGAFISGTGTGLILRTGCSSGGTDIIGVYLAKNVRKLSVGTVQLIINGCIYLICALMFSLSTAIYSIVYAAVYSFILDKMHLQNIEVSIMIFTRNKNVKDMILNEIHRGVTCWNGIGAFTGKDIEVLLVVMSKFEASVLQQKVLAIDPSSFIIINDNATVIGGFEKRLV